MYMKKLNHPKTQAQLKAIEDALNILGELRMIADLSAWPEELLQARFKLHAAHDKILSKCVDK